jgi:hypothetical protein
MVGWSSIPSPSVKLPHWQAHPKHASLAYFTFNLNMPMSTCDESIRDGQPQSLASFKPFCGKERGKHLAQMLWCDAASSVRNTHLYLVTLPGSLDDKIPSCRHRFLSVTDNIQEHLLQTI